MYDKTSCMQAYNSVPQMREAVKVLNIIYCYNRTYEPYLIYWLYPVQIAMSDHQQDGETNHQPSSNFNHGRGGEEIWVGELELEAKNLKSRT